MLKERSLDEISVLCLAWEYSSRQNRDASSIIARANSKAISCIESFIYAHHGGICVNISTKQFTEELYPKQKPAVIIGFRYF